MSTVRKAVFFFCVGPADPVAGKVFEALTGIFPTRATGLRIDDYELLGLELDTGDILHLVRTEGVLSHDYPRYLPLLNRHFRDYDFAGLVNWHEGANAPDAVLTVHSTGDVGSGQFGAAEPRLMRNLLLALERNRSTAKLEEFRVLTEATHWSGMVAGEGDPALIVQYPVPLVDIEIGSSPERWGDPRAAEVLARSLPEVFTDDGRRLRNLLCAGGIHFEPAFSAEVFRVWDDEAYGISHILANQWLVAGAYESDSGRARLEAAAASIRGGIEAIAFHDKLKGVYKDRLRQLGAALGVPVLKHQALRTPERIPWS